MFILSYIFIAVIAIYIGVFIYLYKFTKKRFLNQKYIPKLVVAFFILLPTYDIILTNIFGAYYCATTPSTYINKKVEYPESIYWEDNVYPGFNNEDRKLMIMNYLDGVHLKTMALNGIDGKVYVYTRKVPSERYSELDAKLQLEIKKYNQLDKQFTKKLLKDNEALWLELRDKVNNSRKIVDEMKKEKRDFIDSYPFIKTIFTKETMPKLHYTVTFNEVELNPITRQFLYSDITQMTNNKSGEVIAQNRRIMNLTYNITPNIQGIYYNPEPMCGKRGNIANETFNSRNWRNSYYGTHSRYGSEGRNLHKILRDRFLGEKK